MRCRCLPVSAPYMIITKNLSFMKMTIWYAVNGKGQGRVFTSKPERDDHFKVWLAESVGCVSMMVMLMESDGFELPELKWSDEPVEMEISIRICHG